MCLGKNHANLGHVHKVMLVQLVLFDLLFPLPPELMILFLGDFLPTPLFFLNIQDSFSECCRRRPKIEPEKPIVPT